jgi:hypothetical protein
MTSDARILFIDTNVFLQVRDLKDLPWRDLFPGVRVVDLMAAPIVIEELDKHKTGTNKRRRNRARAALNLIEEASSCEPDLALVLKDNPVRVRIVISRAPRFDWAAHPNLDPANPDDQLVAEAVSFGVAAEIFSHDTGPRIRARSIAKIQAHGPPPEWLLPDEQTDDQRTIARLERDLEQALSRSPKIVARFDEIDEATFEIRVIRPAVQPLDPQLVQRLVERYLATYPPASLARPENAPGFGSVSEGDVRRYGVKYSAFEAKVRQYFAELHQTITRLGTAAAIHYFVKNESGVAAERLRIEVDLEGSGWLLADREDAFIGSLKMPQPPKKPQSMIDYSGSMPLYGPQKPRDPVAFYWFDRPRIGATHSALQCQDFRAMQDFYDCIFVLPHDDPPCDLAIHLHVSATNLPRPVNVSAKLTFAEQAVEWDAAIVQAMLPDWIGQEVP